MEQNDELSRDRAVDPVLPMRCCDHSVCTCADEAAHLPEELIEDADLRDRAIAQTRAHGLWLANILAVSMIGAHIYMEVDGVPSSFHAPEWAVAIVIGTYLTRYVQTAGELLDLLKAILRKRA